MNIYHKHGMFIVCKGSNTHAVLGRQAVVISSVYIHSHTQIWRELTISYACTHEYLRYSAVSNNYCQGICKEKDLYHDSFMMDLCDCFEVINQALLQLQLT